MNMDAVWYVSRKYKKPNLFKSNNNNGIQYFCIIYNIYTTALKVLDLSCEIKSFIILSLLFLYV